MTGYVDNKKQVLTRLRRVEGQVRGRQRRVRRVAGQYRFPRPRFLLVGRPVGGGAGRGRRVRVQGARGHGRPPPGAGHRLDGGRGARRAGRPAHRRAERVPVGRGHPGRARRAHHPCLPRRGLRRRSRTQRPRPGRRTQRHRVLDQPDAALRPRRRQRTSRDHHQPRSQPGAADGRRDGQRPDPAVDDGRRGRLARPRGGAHHLPRRAGDGPGRRDAPAHLRARRQ
jgi:hypothetical protein